MSLPTFNIGREKAVSLASVDYEDADGFYFHTTAGGDICYVPFQNADSESITKTFAASETYNLPVCAKKILKEGTTATGIYAGKSI